MEKTRAKILLTVFGNLLASVLGSILFIFTPLPHIMFPWWWVVPAFVLILHIAGSVFSQQHFRCKFDISAGAYFLHGALPAVGINFVLFILSASSLHKYPDFPIHYFLTEASLEYSVLYCAVFAAVLGVIYAVRKIIGDPLRKKGK
ncbi:MAG: hypothetical protein J1F03_05440 [Oscillospiraceae bacterium]|nr:hypothetical protein [Oscillospiraceae bacterium]